ncbi:hypothetical protein [Komagataeibacter diospyri]|uniref:hypothetical protein n=1 Tax=Komagataeibacter diospyri TaxID=1932662 RepID=UPI0037575073
MFGHGKPADRQEWNSDMPPHAAKASPRQQTSSPHYGKKETGESRKTGICHAIGGTRKFLNDCRIVQDGTVLICATTVMRVMFSMLLVFMPVERMIPMSVMASRKADDDGAGHEYPRNMAHDRPPVATPATRAQGEGLKGTILAVRDGCDPLQAMAYHAMC